MIGTADAIEAARNGIRRLGLDKNPVISEALAKGQPDCPLLVKRLDLENTYYYLVPWLLKNKVVLIVEVDAVSGAMFSVTPLLPPGMHCYPVPEEAKTIVQRQFPNYQTGEPCLVWRPCRESTSPLWPFYQVPLNGKCLYVDMNKKIIHALSPLGKGGE